MCFCMPSEFHLDASVLLLSPQAQYICFILQFWRSKVQNRLAELVPSGDFRKGFISLPFPAARHCPNSLIYNPMSLQPLFLLYLFLVLFSDHSEIIPSTCWWNSEQPEFCTTEIAFEEWRQSRHFQTNQNEYILSLADS